MLLTEFKNYLKANGYSKLYGEAITIYFKYCQEKGVDIGNIKYDNISGFVVELKNNKREDGYINNILKAMRKYYKFLEVSQGYSPALRDIICQFKLLAVERKLRDVLEPEEFANMIGNGMTFLKRYEDHKLQALLFFMFYTGVRQSEVVNIKRKDFDIKECSAIIRVPIKNKQEHYVFYPPKVAEMIRKYFSTEPEIDNAFNMTRHKMYTLMEHLRNMLPRKKKISAHSFRHSFANMLARNNINVRVAQKLLGHKNMASTLIYYDPDVRIVEKVYKDHIIEIEKPNQKELPHGTSTPQQTGENQTGESTEGKGGESPSDPNL